MKIKTTAKSSTKTPATPTPKAKTPVVRVKAAPAPSNSADEFLMNDHGPDSGVRGELHPTDAPAEKKATAMTPSRNISISAFAYPPFNGRHARIMEYQDFTFSLNASKSTPLTNDELATVWQAQFPRAVVFTAKHVAGAHRDFLVNRHSSTFRAWTAEVAIAQLAPFAERLTPDGVQPMDAAPASTAPAQATSTTAKKMAKAAKRAAVKHAA